MKFGVIADDFTGATDIAGFLSESGLSVLQINWKSGQDFMVKDDYDAYVVSLKTRSCPANEAISLSLDAMKWLQKKGCQKFFFKYCSTFDSTLKGNIGPVADKLLQELHADITIVCPSLPINGRTVYNGYLFVWDKLLQESHMRHHPLNPMKDSHIGRLLERQSGFSSGLLDIHTIRNGTESILNKLNEMKQDGIRYAIADTLCDSDLRAIAKACYNYMDFFTGASGLAGALAAFFPHNTAQREKRTPSQGKSIIISCSCSAMTLAQVSRYKNAAPYFYVDVLECRKNVAAYAKKIISWYQKQEHVYWPLLYTSTDTQNIQKIHKEIGSEGAQNTIEQLISIVVKELDKHHVKNFIIAGGEAAGAAVQALSVDSFSIEKTIAPGVPWIKSTENDYFLALKSGNFGNQDFFKTAQDLS